MKYVLLALLLTLTACNTARGIGEDLTSIVV